MHDLMTTPERARRRRIGWLALALAIALLPEVSAAQGDALTVTLRDAADQGIAGITIIVRSEDGQELARQLSDSDGTARFGDLPSVVRVAVDGQPRNAPSLYQLGDDAQGVRLALDVGAAPTVLYLRAERDGLVLPDPATMLSLEVGGPTVAPPLPTLASATSAPLPTRIDPSAPAILVVGAPPAPDPPAPRWAPVAVLLVIIAALVGLLALRWRRAHP
ncbi:MAG: carboxypeptidase-like regulatory domain-containing protein [Chloroflexales bacterium]